MWRALSAAKHHRRKVVLGITPIASALTTTLTAGTFAPAGDGSTTTTQTLTVRDAAGTLIPNAVVTGIRARQKLVSAASSVVTVSPASIANDGVETAVMTTALVNTDGNVIPGVPAASVVEASSGSNNTLTAVDSVSNAAGLITTTVKSTSAEAKTLSATAMGLAITDTALLTVTGSSSRLSSKPAFVSTLVTSRDFDDVADFTDTGSYGSAANISNASPSGDNKVARFRYPSGSAAGFGTGIIENACAAGTLTLYVEYYLYVPTVYTVHPSNHKVTYHSKITAFKNGHVFGIMPGSGVTDYDAGALRWNMQTQTSDSNRFINAGASAPVRGNWYKIAELSVMNTVAGTGDGIYKVWIDDVLSFDYSNVLFAAGGETLEFRIAALDPYYGGNTPGHTIATQFDLLVDYLDIYRATSRS